MNRYHFDEAEHLHTLDNIPLSGTSTVLKVLSKPLTYWAAGKAVELLGWLPTKADPKERLKSAKAGLEACFKMTPKEYLKLLDKAYRNHKTSLDKSADEGTDLHAELQRYIENCMNGENHANQPAYADKIQPFIEWSLKNVRKWLWSERHCYSEMLWTGGICDAGAILNDDTLALIDFKSSKETYTSHWIQCAGYSIAIKQNGLFTKDGASIHKPFKIDKFIVVPFGAEIIEPQFNRLPIEEYEKGFESAVGLYRLMGLEEKLKSKEE